MNTKIVAAHASTRWPATRNTLLMLCVFGVATAAEPAFATAYDAGPLNFATQDQSMWGADNAFVASGTKFVGTGFGGGSSIGGFVAGTGAEVGASGAGVVGLNFGYTVDSGSVNANVGFGAAAEVPHAVQQGQSFNLGTSSALNQGTISTQSPVATADMTLLAQFSGVIYGQGCLAGLCSSSASPLPSININQKILALTANELEFLPGVIPNGADGGSVAHTPLGAQDSPITWNGSEIGSVSTNVPNVATNGSLSGNSISSSGSDPLLTATLDLPDLSSLAGFPTNVDISINKGPFEFEAGFSPLDINIGPQLSLGQDFDLTPTLMVDLAFSKPVMIAGDLLPQWGWEGAWADLPDLALSETTTFTPTFWLDASLTNNTNLDLGLIGTYDFLKYELKLKVGDLTLLDSTESLSQLLGLSDTLFTTPTLNIPIWDNTFDLGGFNAIAAAPFTIYTDSDTSTAVPEPPVVPVFLLGLGALAGLVYFERKREPRDARINFCTKGLAHA
ncbi:MAG TPA: hypothetical protein VFE77_16760 [Rhodanobacter sp.]|nr:hypothetical protein [Rhodanobacter sp.]